MGLLRRPPRPGARYVTTSSLTYGPRPDPGGLRCRRTGEIVQEPGDLDLISDCVETRPSFKYQGVPPSLLGHRSPFLPFGGSPVSYGHSPLTSLYPPGSDSSLPLYISHFFFPFCLHTFSSYL